MSNYYRYKLNPNDTEINIPINISFDMEGREEGVEEFQTNRTKVTQWRATD